MAAATTTAEFTTLVTQTRVLPGRDDEFAVWQQRMSDALAAFPDYVDHTVIEPKPPEQPDWVIVQRFRTPQAARAWLGSEQRLGLLAAVEPSLAGHDDIHIFAGGSAPPPDVAASAVISTQVAPEREAEFRAWQARIAAVEATFPGFRGVRLEPPIPGVQDDWATVLRFDSDEHLQGWLTAPRRQRLMEEAAALGVSSRVRTMRGGFDGWFTFDMPAGEVMPPGWKLNMVVLLVLYPVVFLLGQWFDNPILRANGAPAWLAFFISNAVGVSLMGFFLTARVMRALHWWLAPPPDAPRWTNLAGVALVLALYAVSLAIFSQFP